jgi:TP901 family phage tail tape measure protein
MAGKFSIEAIFSGKNHLSRMLSGMEGRLGRFARNANSKFGQLGAVSNKFARGLSTVSDRFSERMMPSIKGFGVAGAVAGAAASAALLDVVRVGSDFEDTLVRAAVKLGGIRKGTAAFEELRASAEKAGATTEFSAQQAAGALKAFAGGGFDAAQAMAALPKLVDFSTVAEIENLEAGADVLMKTLGALSLKVKDPLQLEKNFARVSDVLARTSDATSASVDSLYQSILEGGPIATTGGANIETLSAILGQLADSGIEASVAGTTAKNFFLSLANPAGEAAAVLDRFGIKTRDAKGNLVDAIGVLGQLEKATAKLGTAEKATALEQIFGKIPLAGVSTLVGEGSFEKLIALRENLYGAAGSTAAQAGIIREDSSKMKIDELTSSWEGLKIAIFGVIGQPVGEAMKSITDSLSSSTGGVTAFFKEAIPFIRTFVDSFKEGFAEAMPPIRAALAILFEGFGGKPTWMETVKQFAKVLGQVAAFAAGAAVVFGGMFAAGIQLVTGAAQALMGVWDGVIATIGEAVFLITDWWNNVTARISAAEGATVLYEVGKAIVQGLAGGINALVNLPFVAVDNIANGIKSRLKGLLGIKSPSKVFQGYGEQTVKGFALGLEPLRDAFSDAMPKLPAQLDLPALRFAPSSNDPLAQLDRIRMMPTASRWLGREADEESPTDARRGAQPAGMSIVRPSSRDDSQAGVEALLEKLIRVTEGKSVDVNVSASGGVEVKKAKTGARVPIRVSESGSFDRRGGR